MYLIDTDWLVDAYIGRPSVGRALDELRPRGIAVSIVSHGELYEGAFGFSDTDMRLDRVRALLAKFETLPLNDSVMEIFGRTRSDLRRRGQLIPDLDLLIAATAVHYGLTLLTRNLRHFARVPELAIYESA